MRAGHQPSRVNRRMLGSEYLQYLARFGLAVRKVANPDVLEFHVALPAGV
jgi:hypothetical protein